MVRTYEQALAYEEENRLLAWRGLGRPLFGRLMPALTWQHVLDLTLAGNAFFAGHPPTRDDVYQFLWRLSPYFSYPSGLLPNWTAPATKPGVLRRVIDQVECYKISREAPEKLERHIYDWIELAYQDTPAGGRKDEVQSDLMPRLRWLDVAMGIWINRRQSIEGSLAMPVAATFQIMRIEAVDAGEGLKFIPPSASLKKFEPE